MIEVVHDEEPAWMPAEPCAFCRAPTRFWFLPKDVAVCPSCAEKVEVSDVPSKRDWLLALGVVLPVGWKCHADVRVESKTGKTKKHG